MVIILSVVSAAYSFGQDYKNIANASFFLLNCYSDSVILTDSGGKDGSYGPNETHEVYICMDLAVNQNIEVLISPDLYGDTWDVDSDSFISIYNNSSSTPIGGGPFNSVNAPNGILVRSTAPCITIAFTSGNNSSGQGFTAHVQCESPFQPFLIDLTADPEFQETSFDSLGIEICHADSFTVTATTTYPLTSANGNGYTQSDSTSYFKWDLGDGTTLMGFGLNEITYAYANGTGQTINLSVTDVLGTIQTKRFNVLQRPRPEFSPAAVNDTICMGSETIISGGSSQQEIVGVSPGTGTLLGGTATSGQVIIDDADIPYCDAQSIALLFTEFEEGQTLNNVNDILNICVNIYHDQLGDLEMGLVCPGGQDTLVLFDMRDGIGMCFGLFDIGFDIFSSRKLGEPNATPTPIGYDYCFNSDPEYGTFEVVESNLPNTVPMPTGSYAPMTSLDGMLGCPLNGEWELLVLDGDQGHFGVINSWSLSFNPDIVASPQSYSAAIVSAGWEENPDLTVNEDSLSVTVAPSNLGDNSYVFWAIDEFGCKHDTVINIYVRSEINLDDSQDCGLSQIILPYGDPDEPITDAEFIVISGPSATAEIIFEQTGSGIYEATATEYGLYEISITSADCGYTNIASLLFLEEDNPACITGLQDIDVKKKFIIAPNPATNYAEIKFEIQKPQSVEIILTALDGKVVSKSKYHFAFGTQVQRINLSEVESGAYMITLLGDTFKSSGLLIKN